MSCRLGILVSHPIQYYVPWFRHLAHRFDVDVFYAHRQDPAGQAAAGFGVAFEWDTSLFGGYRHRWLINVARRPGLQTFGGCDTPEIDPLVRDGRYDAFLVYGWNRKSAIQALRACARHRVPALVRGDSQLRSPRRGWRRAAKYLPYRWGLSRVAGHLVVGQRNREYLRHYGVAEEKLFFVPHCVDNAAFARGAAAAARQGDVRRLRGELGIAPGAFVFAFVGKMIEKKRPHDFLAAYASLLATPAGAGLHALFVGDGPLRASLQEAARPYPRVHFTGFCNQRRLSVLYGAADAIVLPSDGRETWGLVVNEAAACGRPAIVSDAVGCAPDLIRAGQTGFTYPLGDVHACAARMSELRLLVQHAPDRVRTALAGVAAAYSFERATSGLARAVDAVAGGGRERSLDREKASA